MSDPNGNPNALATLWLAVTIGQNWDGTQFNWDGNFVASLPKDTNNTNPQVPDTFNAIKSIVTDNSAAFVTVINLWLQLADSLHYRAPETQPGITNLAKRPRS